MGRVAPALAAAILSCALAGCALPGGGGEPGDGGGQAQAPVGQAQQGGTAGTTVTDLGGDAQAQQGAGTSEVTTDVPDGQAAPAAPSAPAGGDRPGGGLTGREWAASSSPENAAMGAGLESLRMPGSVTAGGIEAWPTSWRHNDTSAEGTYQGDGVTVTLRKGREVYSRDLAEDDSRRPARWILLTDTVKVVCEGPGEGQATFVYWSAGYRGYTAVIEGAAMSDAEVATLFDSFS